MPRLLGRFSHLRTGTGFILLAVLAGLVGGALSLCLHVPALMQGPHAAAWRVVALRHATGGDVGDQGRQVVEVHPGEAPRG